MTAIERDNRIVVTGLGAVSPIGVSAPETFANLVAGVPGVDRITHFDASKQRCRIAGEARRFDALAHMDRKTARRIGRYAQFAISATREALAQAALEIDPARADRVGVIIGSAIGDFPMLEDEIRLYFERGPGKTNPFTVPRVSTNMAAGNVSLMLGATGPTFGTASACATGSHAIAIAWMLLHAGLADVVIAGGTEAAITECFVESYVAMGALSTRNAEPARASRPFDRDRDGFVLGEGCGVLVLETSAHAHARGATVLAELAGVGMSADAHHITAGHPDGDGAARAMSRAIESAGAQPNDVDYVSAHGTSTKLNDPVETMAIKAALGDHAANVRVSAIKSMIGHCIGAAGAIAAVATVMSLRDGVVPPTINLDAPDPSCDLDYVPHVARRCDLRFALANSFAFGGQNCVLAFRRAASASAPEKARPAPFGS